MINCDCECHVIPGAPGATCKRCCNGYVSEVCLLELARDLKTLADGMMTRVDRLPDKEDFLVVLREYFR